MGPFEKQIEANFTVTEGGEFIQIWGRDINAINRFVANWQKRHGFIVNHRTMVRGIKNASQMETALWDIYREKWKQARGFESSDRPRGQDAEDMMGFLDSVSRYAGEAAVKIEDNPAGSKQTARRPLGGL